MSLFEITRASVLFSQTFYSNLKLQGDVTRDDLCSHESLRVFPVLYFSCFALSKVSLISTFVIALGVVFC